MRKPFLVLLLLALGCGDDDSSALDVGPQIDAATAEDGGDGASSDAAADADASADVGPDRDAPEMDAGVDAPMDVPPDVPDTCTPLDLLFIIDDSGSMAEEQFALSESSPRVLAALDAARSGAAELDYHLGVTTTGKDITVNIEFIGGPGIPPMVINETGPGGALLEPEACGMAQPWLERDDVGVDDALACLMQVGTGGSGFEMPLLATESALTTRVADGSNEGFLRPNARLGVIIITDENDCSVDADVLTSRIPFDPDAGEEVDPCDDAIDVSRTVGVLDAVLGDRSRWGVSIIAAPEDCTSMLGDALAAPRLYSFADEAPMNIDTDTICTDALGDAIEAAVQRYAVCD